MKYTKSHSEAENKSQSHSYKGMASGSYKIKVPFVCTFYNQKRCSKSNCTFLHICEGFLDSTCTGCTLSHDIKADQPVSVLSAYGFITSQNAESIFEQYKFRLQQAGKNQRGKTASRDKKETTREQETEESDEVLQKGRKGKNGNKSSHVDSNEDTEYPYLICKNYNQNKCNSPHCKYLHICGKFILDECESKSTCPYNLNRRLFYQNNKPVLDGARYNTDQNEAELLKEYKRNSQKKFAIWKQRQNQPMENKELSKQSTTPETKESTSKSKPYMTKTIIQSEDVDICRSNIRERCKYGVNCNRHHCNLPYHWQYKVPTQPWKSFPLVVNETLEMNFCDKDIDNAIVSVANDRCVVDFNQMKGKLRDGELTLRRLSTSSACEAPPGETLVTNWTWYWKHENYGIQKYTNESQGDSTVSEIGREIEEKYIEDPENTIIINSDIYLYRIDFKNMKQTNIVSKKERDVRRRPEYRSKEDVEKEAKERRKISKKVDIKQSSLQQQSGGLPNHWANMNDEEEEMKRVLIQRSEKEYMDVFKVFVSSLGRSDVVVESIERIQNPYLWQNYEW
ncbi:hypothetical protein KUTeg_010571 [Tegillarca granosa]|uniref:Uncharacterized protein n=1 Tax=Tegillarca granosa TaxID=220873 RepID=A0ABQ9F8C2_TEGGR|nr:hypothetical protein KUTeg_010571 [Tegillarca granosa]